MHITSTSRNRSGSEDERQRVVIRYCHPLRQRLRQRCRKQNGTVVVYLEGLQRDPTQGQQVVLVTNQGKQLGMGSNLLYCIRLKLLLSLYQKSSIFKYSDSNLVLNLLVRPLKPCVLALHERVKFILKLSLHQVQSFK